MVTTASLSMPIPFLIALLSMMMMTSLPLVTSLPSTRVVYYLHQEPATWNEASAMCQTYGAVLLTMPDFVAVNNSLTYVNANSWNGALETLTTGFWSGLYRNTTGTLRWQKCTMYDSTTTPPLVDTSGSENPCYQSDSTLQLSDVHCSQRRPYVCQRDDGQCWFQPYVDNGVQDTDPNTAHTNATATAADEGECAKLCRSAVEESRECWAFTFKGTECHLHFSAEPHKYSLNLNSHYFSAAPGYTAYVKVCTGGYVTSMAASSTDTSSTARNENCSVTTADVWDTAVCYCECDQPPVILAAETLVMTIDEKVERIVQELTVNPLNTSSTRRTKESAEDSRPSAQGIGYFGVGFLVVIFSCILLLDVNILFRHAASICSSGPHFSHEATPSK